MAHLRSHHLDAMGVLGQSILLDVRPSSIPTLEVYRACRIPWLLHPPRVMPGRSRTLSSQESEERPAVVSLAWIVRTFLPARTALRRPSTAASLLQTRNSLMASND